MTFESFFQKCQNESTVSDFESYLSHCILEKRKGHVECTTEAYNRMRDLAFERRDEAVARTLFTLSGASTWQEGEWEGMLR